MRTDPLENPVAFDPDIKELADEGFVVDLATLAQEGREQADRLHDTLLAMGMSESLVWRIRFGLSWVVV